MGRKNSGGAVGTGGADRVSESAKPATDTRTATDGERIESAREQTVPQRGNLTAAKYDTTDIFAEKTVPHDVAPVTGGGAADASAENVSPKGGPFAADAKTEDARAGKTALRDGLPAAAADAGRTEPHFGKKLPRHLLVMRNSAMGDVAMLPHALRALMAAYPALRVTVATQPMFRPFFDGLEVEFLDVDTKGAQHALSGMWRLAAEARRRGVDAVADVHGVMRSEAFALSMRLHGIAVAGIRKGRAEKRRFIRDGGRGMEPLRHTVLRYCDVFRRLGFVFDDPGPVAALPRANPMGEKLGVWVGFAPFSAHAGKTYPEAMSREAVALLAERYERVFIHGGGGREAEFAQEMERVHPNVTALYGRVRFAGEMDLIANLDCVVSMDSLVMHLAALVGTPVVSVWGATHPGLGFLGWGCDPGNVLQAEAACRPCSVFGSKPCRFGDYRCLRAVTPEMIARQVAAVLEKKKAERERQA